MKEFYDLMGRDGWEAEDGTQFANVIECKVYEKMKKLNFVKYHEVTSEYLAYAIEETNWWPNPYMYVITPKTWEDVTLISEITSDYLDDCQTYGPGDKVILTLSGGSEYNPYEEHYCEDDDRLVRHIIHYDCIVKHFQKLGEELAKI